MGFGLEELKLLSNTINEITVANKSSIKLLIYESGPNHEEMEDVLCT